MYHKLQVGNPQYGHIGPLGYRIPPHWPNYPCLHADPFVAGHSLLFLGWPAAWQATRGHSRLSIQSIKKQTKLLFYFFQTLALLTLYMLLCTSIDDICGWSRWPCQPRTTLVAPLLHAPSWETFQGFSPRLTYRNSKPPHQVGSESAQAGFPCLAMNLILEWSKQLSHENWVC